MSKTSLSLLRGKSNSPILTLLRYCTGDEATQRSCVKFIFASCCGTLLVESNR